MLEVGRPENLAVTGLWKPGVAEASLQLAKKVGAVVVGICGSCK